MADVAMEENNTNAEAQEQFENLNWSSKVCNINVAYRRR